MKRAGRETMGSRLSKVFSGRAGLFYGLLLVVLCQLMVAFMLGLNVFEHSVYDSYTLQALTWRSGRISLPQNFAHLEIAVFQGKYYISFPPFPALPMLLLTYLFGENTPSMLVSMAYFCGGYVFAYCAARRKMGDAGAAGAAAFMALGSNLFEVALYGGVWNQAQALCFMLSSLCVWGITSGTRRGMAIGLFSLACAVGCRPFQALYVPLALVLLYRFSKGRVSAMVPYLLAPAALALVYAAYNVYRFGSPLEFGHNYLPEFTQASHGQFSLAYVPQNFSNLLRLPWFEGNRLVFPRDSGFLVWIANPIFLLFTIEIARRLYREEMDLTTAIIGGTALVHTFLFLMHKSFGGWQFGTRYLCDMIPFLFYGWLHGKKRPGRFFGWEIPMMLFAVVFNIYGAMVFHMYL